MRLPRTFRVFAMTDTNKPCSDTNPSYRARAELVDGLLTTERTVAYYMNPPESTAKVRDFLFSDDYMYDKGNEALVLCER